MDAPPNPVAVAAVSAPPPVWQDARFQLPLALVGASVLAAATFAVLHFALGRRRAEEDEGARDERGWRFPKSGYVLCPQGAGLEPTAKDIEVGSILVLGLGSSTGQPVEPAWARVVEIDARDPNRIAVVLVGQATLAGQTGFQTDRHGFRLAQKLWVTKDCVWDVLRMLDDPGGVLLCGADLALFDGPDPDSAPDELGPAPMPARVRDLVGRAVELLLVSRAGKGTAWQVPVTAEIVDVGETGHVATVRVLAIARDDEAERPGVGHELTPGQTFDITWDCVVRYL